MFLARRGLEGGGRWWWGEKPPENPTDPGVTWGQALAWAGATGAAMALARLLALRDWMPEQQAEAVSSSYFGSALPVGCGIRYRALRSFLSAPEDPLGPPARPEWTAIPATNLYGLYFDGADPYASCRTREPEAVLAGSILLFRDGLGRSSDAGP